MTAPLFDRLKRFQEFVLELGLAQAVLALPAPGMLALAAPSAEGIKAAHAKSSD
jgi:hypothetical protein